MMASVAVATGITSVLFLLAWWYASRVDNYSLVDAVWSFGIGLVGLFWLTQSSGGPKSWVAGGLLTVWSLRLTWHLQRRIRKHHPNEDSRYVKLREVWKGRVVSGFFWFFQAQAISVILLALPFLFISRDPDNTWGTWESVGLVLCIMGIFGESLADSQMSAFKAGNPDPKLVCKRGLWRYSRHPNYFFESVIWIGFYIFACGSDWGWVTIHAPAMIIYLLLRVTGIPPTEAAAVLRKGEAYREYQKNTSAFIPWPPRS